MDYAGMLGTNTIAFLCVHKWIICHETRNDLYEIASQFMDVCPRSGGDFGGNLHIVARYLYYIQDRCNIWSRDSYTSILPQI